MINVNANIRFDDKEMKKIESDIRRGVLYNIQSRLLRAIPFLEKILPTEIRERINNSDVMNELRSGQLRYDLGLKPEEVQIMSEKIPETISKNIIVRVDVHPQESSVSLIVEMIKDGLEELLALPEASFIQTYTRNTPEEIRWLEWLLTKGDNIIVYEHCVWYTPGNPNSRSGGAVTAKPGSFRIRPQWSGVEDNNFITRALEDIDDFVYDIVNQFLLEGKI